MRHTYISSDVSLFDQLLIRMYFSKLRASLLPIYEYLMWNRNTNLKGFNLCSPLAMQLTEFYFSFTDVACILKKKQKKPHWTLFSINVSLYTDKNIWNLNLKTNLKCPYHIKQGVDSLGWVHVFSIYQLKRLKPFTE